MRRTFFVVAFSANVALALLSLAVLPEKVAIHFGLGGRPDSWASKETNALLFLGIEIPLFLLLWFTPALTLKLPPGLVNLPNKRYWLREEHRGVLKEKLDHHMALFGTALFLFLFGVGLLTIEANRSAPVRLNEKVFFLLLGLFILYTIVWSIALVRALRVPKDDSARTSTTG